MSWFGGGSKKTEKARKKQILSLESKNGKSYKVYKMARNHFRVTFICRGFPDPLAIQVHFSEDFPDSPPKISVDRKYSHHLLDDNGVVTKLDELNKWSPHSDLGNIVQKITNMFNISQPTIKHNFPSQQPPPQQQQPWGNSQLPSYGDHIDRSQSHPHQPNNYNMGPYGNPNMQARNSMPPSQYGGGGPGGPGSGPGGAYSQYNNSQYQNSQYNSNLNDNNRRQSQHQHEPTSDLSTMKLSPPSIIPGFAEKTLTELEEMDKEPQLVKDFAYNVASTLREMKREAQNGCMQTAQQNITDHGKAQELVKTNEELRANVDTLTELYKSLKKREEKVLQKFSSQRILQQMDVELDKIDKQCEELKDKFESGDITYVIWCKKLAKLRTAYHDIAIKKEKLTIRVGGYF